MTYDPKARCIENDVLLSYVFGDLPENEQDIVDLHFTECDVCTDRFAQLAAVRLPIHEWKHLVFDALPTPVMTIPYKETERSWPRFWVLGWNWYSGIALAAAVVVISLAGVFALVNSHSDVAANISPFSDKDEISSAVPENNGEKIEQEKFAADDLKIRSQDQDQTKHAVSRVSVVPAAKKIMRGQRTAAISAAKPEVKQARIPQDIPVLSQFDEVKDDSLRLAELFEDIDTRD